MKYGKNSAKFHVLLRFYNGTYQSYHLVIENPFSFMNKFFAKEGTPELTEKQVGLYLAKIIFGERENSAEGVPLIGEDKNWISPPKHIVAFEEGAVVKCSVVMSIDCVKKIGDKGCLKED